MAGTTGN